MKPIRRITADNRGVRINPKVKDYDEHKSYLVLRFKADFDRMNTWTQVLGIDTSTPLEVLQNKQDGGRFLGAVEAFMDDHAKGLRVSIPSDLSGFEMDGETIDEVLMVLEELKATYNRAKKEVAKK
jgi:hypothetical protein